MPEISYTWRNSQSIDDELLHQCANLFSEHYGTWSIADPKGRGGRPVRLSAVELRKLVAAPGSCASLAFCGDCLVGHAFSLRRELHKGFITWVTQLVVHKDFRKRGVAKQLLSSIWAFSDDFAWGLVTANPIAVKTLQRSTRRTCSPRVIYKNLSMLKGVANDIPYVREEMFQVEPARSIVNTEFFVDHSQVPSLIARVEGTEWRLGKDLKEGEEWLAFTFRRQKARPLNKTELDQMLRQNEQIVQEAYGRMTLNIDHRWAQHAPKEVAFFLQETKLPSGSLVADFGCGLGRHSIELAEQGYQVVGIESVEPFVKRATATAQAKRLHNVVFHHKDARSADLGEQFDAVLCLYDVVGSYPEELENQRIVDNLVHHLKPGGYLLLSVMNMELTEALAIHKGDAYEDPAILQDLLPSRIMQESGNIFDPRHFLLDTSSGTVFRKEQFAEDGLLSAELVVRDRRYRREEIRKACSALGCSEILCRYVQAGRWEAELAATDQKAKEILYLGRKII